ncbi:MAG: hypothetical protein GY719_08665 [bacterium]|nr:hypothetical protein [bacterium]
MSDCIEWGVERHQECSKTADQGYNECSRTEDQGYSQCSQRRDAGYRNCCDWWPCSMFCRAWVWISNVVCVAWTWISNVVCVAWTWISNVVCVAWTWISTAVCLAWAAVVTIVNAVLVTIESIVGWVLSALAFLVELIEMIPVLGTLVRWILNAVTAAINIVGSLVDGFLGFIGVRPEKILRVCPVILRDEDGAVTASEEVAVAMLQLAVDVYKRDANVRIVPLAAFKYSSEFAAGETVDESWLTTDGANSDSTLLDVPCNGGGAGADWLLTGSGFQWKMSTLCFYGAWRRVLGYGAPITCFFVRSVPPNSLGCGLWITDYVTIVGNIEPPPKSPRTLGHEVGHACNLWHLCVDDDNRNLMGVRGACNPASATPSDRANPRMSEAQTLLVRGSKHVTYF